MRKLLQFVSLMGLLLVLPGCGMIDYYLLPPPEDTAQELYEAGLDAMKAKEFESAAGHFQALKDRYPFSPYTPKAELSLGDAWFLAEEYQMAADVYEEFEALHPRHEMIEYVLFQVGVSNFKLFESIDKPHNTVRTAIEYFTRLKQVYPESKYIAEADRYIVECRRLMAEHEVFVADFYWRSERYGSAWERYTYIKDNFQDLPEIAAYAAKRAEIAWLKHQKLTSEEERERLQGSWKEWLDWL
ncbi:outer membrane protein assembly factor BamD [Desulfovibrio ferrophilus]|uniref:Outer membrane assembly lipoprotein YfiO n=1 Tax=Desulfovibrio ferrophilus TaxID=241368 RepID=A0A2Z6AXC0_9BACT|nr:outer membrane protein assembly factor BamD [Desulfovibrio ferrophilus]BBD07796.1 outer membrane assembly lipoprotein YfiO [Desulfovibrio ferrophilus]